VRCSVPSSQSSGAPSADNPLMREANAVSGSTSSSSQVTDLTRDARTVMVGSLLKRVDEDWLRSWFEPIGPVVAIQVIRDRRGDSRGHAYVEFRELDDVPKALLMNSRPMCTKHRGCTCSGFPATVSRSGVEANYAKDAEEEESKAVRMDTVYLGDLPKSFQESQVRGIASPHGPIKSVILHHVTEASGASVRVWAEVTYLDVATASTALQALQNHKVQGTRLRVGLMRVDGDVLAPDGGIFEANDPTKTRLSAAQKAEVLRQMASRTQETAASLSQAMHEAMGTSSSSARVLEVDGGSDEGPELRGDVSACFVVENLFTMESRDLMDFGPAINHEPWKVLLKDDIVGECDRQGTVLHSKLLYPMAESDPDFDPTSSTSVGRVAVMMESRETGYAAASAVAGRYYAGRKVRVAFVPEVEYIKQYPSATKRVEKQAEKMIRRQRKREEKAARRLRDEPSSSSRRSHSSSRPRDDDHHRSRDGSRSRGRDDGGYRRGGSGREGSYSRGRDGGDYPRGGRGRDEARY
jgi:hypothetical protein